MYELPFSEASKRTMRSAVQQARRLNHRYVGTEHILLAFIDEVRGSSPHEQNVFADALARARASIETWIVPGVDDVSNCKMVQTPQTKSAIQNAIAAAQDAGESCVEMEHLLLGLLRTPESMAHRFLVESGAIASKPI